MTAPVATARVTPDGIKLDDGYQTLVTFAADPNVRLWEKAVTPPGIDGGDAIETTTMHNTTWRTMAPRALRTLTQHTFTAAYDPAIYTQILSLINVRTTITVTFPDTSTLAFYGFLQLFEPGEMTEGEQPEATVTITPTNYDPAAATEEAPVLNSAEGT